jgi:uncharacterized protein YcaQ
VIARAHELVFFSRLGPYDVGALESFLWHSGEVFEYWGHEASLLDVRDRPLFTHRMFGGWHWPRVEAFGDEQPDLVEAVLEAVRERGPLRPRDVTAETGAGPWWGWSDTKIAFEHLFLRGKLTTAHRVGFERWYDLPGRVHPPRIMEQPPVPAVTARAQLLASAAHALGVGTAADLADYHRIRLRDAAEPLAALVADGSLVEVEVEGWSKIAYAPPEVTIPRSIRAQALLAPFDPVVWHRERAERLFDFRYRLEIYTPEHEREYGYYVLPFLMDETLVARVCLKADRRGRRLLVRAAHAESGVDGCGVAARLAGELEVMARWLDLEEVEVADVGDLATALRRSV